MSDAHTAPPGQQVRGGRWYFVVAIMTAGIMAWIPFAHAAYRVGRTRVRVQAVAYGVAGAGLMALTSVVPDNADGGLDGVLSGLASFFAIVLVIVACVQLAPLRREVYAGIRPPGAGPLPDPALAAALAARAKRDSSRELAAKDPLLARDLRIGRPDLSRDFDDGGLVELNTAPAAVIAEVCGLSRAVADGIVTARDAIGFHTVEDVLTLADVPIEAWAVVRDRGIVIPR